MSENAVGSSENVREKFPRWDGKQCGVCCHLTVITRHCRSGDPLRGTFDDREMPHGSVYAPSHARGYHPEGKSHPKEVQWGFGEWRLSDDLGGLEKHQVFLC